MPAAALPREKLPSVEDKLHPTTGRPIPVVSCSATTSHLPQPTPAKAGGRRPWATACPAPVRSLLHRAGRNLAARAVSPRRQLQEAMDEASREASAACNPCFGCTGGKLGEIGSLESFGRCGAASGGEPTSACRAVASSCRPWWQSMLFVTVRESRPNPLAATRLRPADFATASGSWKGGFGIGKPWVDSSHCFNSFTLKKGKISPAGRAESPWQPRCGIVARTGSGGQHTAAGWGVSSSGRRWWWPTLFKRVLGSGSNALVATLQRPADLVKACATRAKGFRDWQVMGRFFALF